MPVQQDQIEVLGTQSGQQVTALVITGAGVSRGGQHLVDAPGLIEVVFQRRDFHQTCSREGLLRKRALWRPTARGVSEIM
ncbi:hypothetical protein G6F57_022825 [Rhizopus arrhizus]|nr:hypothetical protein G6F24_015367 [Rhizopus arrhizus]KAG1432513.1 hypothetical protein G6F57_022825 [Rhizopus arrhizus]KAG1587397.1 hypothetical protein G6F46_014744 [Rhizopus delemar]